MSDTNLEDWTAFLAAGHEVGDVARPWVCLSCERSFGQFLSLSEQDRQEPCRGYVLPGEELHVMQDGTTQWIQHQRT